MKSFWTYDIFESRDTRAYEVRLASEVDAEIADMRAGFQLELASKDARIEQMERLINEARFFVQEDFPPANDFPPEMLEMSDVCATERYLQYWKDLNRFL